EGRRIHAVSARGFTDGGIIVERERNMRVNGVKALHFLGSRLAVGVGLGLCAGEADYRAEIAAADPGTRVGNDIEWLDRTDAMSSGGEDEVGSVGDRLRIGGSSRAS